MKNVWFISDPHLGHKNVINFLKSDGSKLRDFDTIEEHDETFIQNHNAIVGEFDRVYIMGDAVINRSSLPKFARLKGKKKLIKGNHDIFRLSDYAPYFEDIVSCRVYPEHGLIFTHIPVHESQLERFKINCHGHTHGNFITKKAYIHYPTEHCWKPENIPDERYINLCAENINYTPVSLDSIIEGMNK